MLDETAAITETLGSLQDDIIKLGADLQKAKDEELTVLREQRRRKYVELRDGLKGHVNIIVELEAVGRDTRQAKKMAADSTKQVSTWLKAEISESLTLLARLDEQVKTASDSEVFELRQQIAIERKAVDEELAALLENTALMELLSLNNLPDLNYLDKILVTRAENLAAKLQYLVEQRHGLRNQGIGANEDDKKVLKEKVAALDGRVSSTAENLKFTIDFMGARKLDAAEYKQIVISATGEITKDIFDTEVALGLLQQWLDSGKEWLIDKGPQWAFKLVVFVLILLTFAMFANIVKRIISRALTSSRVHASHLLQNLLVSFAGKAIFLVGILIALAQLGIKIGPVLAGLGIVGFIVGFALQETLSNFAAGMMILIYRPFDVGTPLKPVELAEKCSR
jgi:small conductance mechanosensitive channel